jgi:AraC family transcriptional activator of mtrCDE
MRTNPQDDKIMGTSTLDALLSALSVDVEAFALCEIAENVCLVFPPMDVIEVHHVLEGTLYLTIGDNDPIEAPYGSVVIVPPGRLQYLASSKRVSTSKISVDVCLPVRDGMVILDATDGGQSVLRIACGTVEPDPNGSYGPLDGLSQQVAENLSDVPVVSAAFKAMMEEVAAPEEGAMALTSALMKACLVVLLRRHLHSSRDAETPPALFSDARIGRAIAAVLDHPSAAHSVTTLAKKAAMSRSAFARDFKATLGVTPMEFVNRTRLSLARRLLAFTVRPVEAIAAEVGFSSRSHFSRVFRDQYGIDPSAFRKRNFLGFSPDEAAARSGPTTRRLGSERGLAVS